MNTKIPKGNRLLLIIFVTLVIVDVVLISIRKNVPLIPVVAQKTWPIESIDTVKYSRDLAREFSKDASFDTTIDLQVKKIAETGANYIAIGTPYDQEFIPFLARWVSIARKHNLKVWFRGNFAGWEEWFSYKTITREEHKQMLKKFILDNGNLFEDGDIFTACTECENGGPGDPRQTGDVSGHRQFLIDEYQIAREAFRQVDRNVSSNYFPMNYDVASLIMDPATTSALGGVIVIDHYVGTPDYLDTSIKSLGDKSGGKIVLGEFGAPIPDIHGFLTEKEQAAWIGDALTKLANNSNVIGVNYWTSFGGSTRLWRDNGEKTQAVETLKSFYVPKAIAGRVQNEAGHFVTNATIRSAFQTTTTGPLGDFVLTHTDNPNGLNITINAEGYLPKNIILKGDRELLTINLKKRSESFIFKIQKLLHQKLNI